MVRATGQDARHVPLVEGSRVEQRGGGELGLGADRQRSGQSQPADQLESVVVVVRNIDDIRFWLKAVLTKLR